MPARPKVVAFDIIGTVFSLEVLRPRFVAAGLPGGALELWFAQSLRDAFALAATDGFQPFRAVLEAALDQLFAQHRITSDPERRRRVLDGLSALPAYPDAGHAFRTLGGAGIRILALTNGGAAATETLLDGAGLRDHVERVVSVDEVKRAKPRREVYEHAAEVADVAPVDLALVAAHAWDVHGAKMAGLTAGFVARGRPFPPSMAPPDLQGESLAELAGKLARMA